MSEVDERSVHTKPGPTQRASDGSPVRVFVLGAIVIVVIVAALLAAIRTFVFPIWEENSEGVRQVATAQAQLSVAMTQEAVRPTSASTPVSAAATQLTSEPTPLTTATAASAAQAIVTPAPAGVGTTPLALASATPTNLPTPTAEQAEEIALAYKNYFDVTGEALLNLDPTPLDGVAAGSELESLQRDIEQDRAKGRALQTNVQHDQVYVLDVYGDEADVADRYRDSSIYVDPQTGGPLPGQVAPDSPELAPAVSVIYHLQRIDGIWKVVSGRRFAPQGTQ
jgi:cytoskeletal protein RodZ